jgi:hypothetical protein
MIEVLKQARKAFEVATTPLAKDRQEVLEAVAAINQAIAELASQEPVAWMWKDMREQEIVSLFEPRLNSVPLFTHPPQRTWVGLTDEDVMEVWEKIKDGDWAIDFYDVIEAKLKEKNT